MSVSDHDGFTFTPGAKHVESAYMPAAKTILITNNYTTHHAGSKNTGTGPGGSNTTTTGTGSITIVTSPESAAAAAAGATANNQQTVVLDRINICINNHYDGQMQSQQLMSCIKEEKKDVAAEVAASMKAIMKFKENDDVLVQQEDGKFFFGTVIGVTASQCLIKYDDNTKKWASHSQLKRFGVTEDDTGPLCVVCKETHKEKVEVCEGCSRGYHPRCSDGIYGDKGNWYCHRCSIHDETESEVNVDDPDDKTIDPELQIKPNYIEKLPYNLDSLHWDAFHRENKEEKYCYCGGPGEWSRQMLQCSRCQQWFHEKCIQKLQFPVFAGDRFYVFVCKLCNNGTEFIKRLEMEWADLIQIALFNLTIHNTQQFFHADNILMRYLGDMKNALQITNQMKNDLKMRERVTKALTDYTRFKNGSEQRLSKKLWALRAISPPNAPFITLPKDGNAVTEQYIKSLFTLTKIPINFVYSDFSKIKLNVQKIRNRMTGQYLLHSSPIESEGDSSKFESEDEIPVKFVIEREKESSKSPPKAKKRLRSRDSYSDTSSSSLQQLKKTRKSDAGGKDKHSKAKGTQKGRRSKKRTEEAFDSSNDDDASSRSTLDFIIPPLKNFQGANNPFNTLFGRPGSDEVKKDEQNGVPTLSKPPVLKHVPLSNGVRIVRTVRRRLSAKDIIIGPNQQVKRKKTKRKISPGDVEVISTTMINTHPATSFLPFRTEFKDWNSSNTSSSLPSQATSRRSSSASLNNSQPEATAPSSVVVVAAMAPTTKSEAPTTSNAAAAASMQGGTPSSSSSSQSTEASSSSTSVTNYFAAVNRIRNGEGFRLLGRRTNEGGKVQYLIEWNGNGNTSLF